MIQPFLTFQKFPGHLEPIKNDTGFAGSSKFMYASDSEESESDITGSSCRRKKSI